MKLTDENKKFIDEKDIHALLAGWRFAVTGDPWFQGETGEYWGKRMAELRDRPEGSGEFFAASKALGW